MLPKNFKLRLKLLGNSSEGPTCYQFSFLFLSNDLKCYNPLYKILKTNILSPLPENCQKHFEIFIIDLFTSYWEQKGVIMTFLNDIWAHVQPKAQVSFKPSFSFFIFIIKKAWANITFSFQ